MVARLFCAGLLAPLLVAVCSPSVPAPAPSATDSPVPAGPSTPAAASGATTPAVSASPTPAPRLPDGAELAPIDVGPGIDLPKDVALIIETGCWQCDGPTTSLTRVHWQATAGQYVFEPLISAETMGIAPHVVQTEKGPIELGPVIRGFAAEPDASDIVVGICTAGFCGGLEAPSADAVTSLFRSRDGGVTWADYGTLAGAVFISGAIRNGEILVGRYSRETAATVPPGGTPPPLKSPDYYVYPGGEATSTPAGADAYWRPVILPGGDVAWLTHDGRLVDVAGAQIAATGGSFGYLPRVYAAPGGIALEWGYANAGPNYLGVFDANGHAPLVYQFPSFFLPGPWIGNLRLFGNTGVGTGQPTVPLPSFSAGYLPALVDLNERLVHPIVRPFLDPGASPGRNHVVAVQRGTLLRVVNTGSCLNVRAAPDAAAPALDCVADGVLLSLGIGNGQYPGGVYDVGGATWYSVITPAGGEGFASGEYLER